jgi:hypothetical protein
MGPKLPLPWRERFGVRGNQIEVILFLPLPAFPVNGEEKIDMV